MSDNRRHAIPFEILDEISARFIINIPLEERKDLVRVCFQIEAAHWFYMDFYVSKQETKNLRPDQRLQSGTMKEFSAHIFQHVPYLQKHAHRVEEIVEEWREYKLGVPTFGAIIINENYDKVVLAQSWGKQNWGFPKGKVNEEELPHVCAAREVYEETGFDINPYLDEQDFIEQVINDQTVRLYLIPGVSEDTKFQTQTRCEIRAIEWFNVQLLPTNKKDQSCRENLGTSATNFFMVIPFLRNLKIWLKNNKKNIKTRAKQNYERRMKTYSESSDGKPEIGRRIGEPTGKLRSLCQSLYRTDSVESGVNSLKSEESSENDPFLVKSGENSENEPDSVKSEENSENDPDSVKSEENSENDPDHHLKVNANNPVMDKANNENDFLPKTVETVKLKSLDEKYCPEAWKNFKLNQEDIMMSFRF